MLALDRNGDGVINNGGELFGNYTRLADGTLAENGFEALSELDTNGDGVVDAADAQYADLRVWRDLDQDGETDAGELLTLAEAGVDALALDYSEQQQTDEFGNEHRQVGSYTNTAGQTQNMTDVWFARNVTDSEGEAIEVSADIALLPDAMGFGKTHSLHQADEARKSLEALRAFSMENTDVRVIFGHDAG